MENVFDTITMQAAHEKAITAGKKAAQAVSNTYFGGGDGGACGFSWVTAEKTRANSKQGKALAALGFRKDYTNSFQLWNKWWPGQSVDAGYEGARAYAQVFEAETGIKMYAGSRLD
tara:strand:+ start:1204 stop:1551 length:348 start_codon:yes stop_codon:yes gene_type:complete